MTDPASHIPRELICIIAPSATDVEVRRLTGGVSASMFVVSWTDAAAETDSVVVRRREQGFGELTLAQEFDLLTALHDGGLPVPRPRRRWSKDTIVMDWVEGTTQPPHDAPSRMAAGLARIHAHRPLPDGLPAREDPTPVLADVLNDSELARMSAFEQEQASLLHGDFWPGNLLWRNGELAAILDWEDAAVGDPLSDVACARVELAVALGADAGTTFTNHYFSVTGQSATRLAGWDAYVSIAALASMHSWGLRDDELAHRQQITRAFRDDALSRLRGR